ncbi:hypothetical protein PAT3040_03896 [Paenibacillus agaridevorans]|uniref:Uncharacterized protein n=1 Tax=Paenibacillus agaridevorans TaxID=171404 RepID=A0A2R5ESZ5_9BACL|nr:hypothetical protein [Paenibacillus agaridevorans]GBG09255.1 hypothetical protein PAT3040_03896 [Paenibacillus agaridevorans]
MQVSFKQMFMRKLISAAIATSLFSILYAWFGPDPFGDKARFYSLSDRLHEAIGYTMIYMMYAAPAIYIYGVITSVISELISRAATSHQWLRLVISAILHIAFGLILLYISLLAAVLFFMADTLLVLFRKKSYTIKYTLASLLLPLTIWLACLAYIHIMG